MKFRQTDSDIAPYNKFNATEKKQTQRVRRKNGDEVGEQISLPQTQLNMMEPNFCLLSTKLDFVTIITDPCDFFCRNLLSRLA